jgi:hypothetical protein
MQLVHSRGFLVIDRGALVNHTVGKKLFTRKEWEKDESLAVGEITVVQVVSRDRREFAVVVTGQFGKTQVEVDGIKSKSDLDTFLRELAAANPRTALWLAHPSHGLPDPIHENAVKAAAQAAKYNEDESKRQLAAANLKPKVLVKIYDKHRDYAKDAPRMAVQGWMPQGETSSAGALKGSARTGYKGKEPKITVTWVRQPAPYVPREFAVVPPIPAPRQFPPEPYFAAKLVNPVRPGEEFAAASSSQPRSASPVPVAPARPALDTPSQGPITQEDRGVPVAPVLSVADRLRQLAALRDEGIITAEEFESTKAQLLTKM